MKQARHGFEASRTARWVAAARTFGALLPEELVLARDPHGLAFADGLVRHVADALIRRPRLGRALIRRAGPLTSFLLWMQLRTRALDDVLLEFVKAGGRQVVLLGAGYDSRALRFARELAECTVFEVDHPATQAGKIAGLPAETLTSRVLYVGWDFEHGSLALLPARLHELGLDRDAAVLTIWEGVTMYLGEPAIEATVRAVRAFGGVGSELAVTYIDRAALVRPDAELGLSRRIVASVGEPWRFGWQPREFGRWFSARGFDVVSDVTDLELCARHYPVRWTRFFGNKTRHVAVVRVRERRAHPLSRAT